MHLKHKEHEWFTGSLPLPKTEKVLIFIYKCISLYLRYNL